MEEFEERSSLPLYISQVHGHSKSIENITKIQFLKCENFFLEQDIIKKIGDKKGLDHYLSLISKIKQFDDIVQSYELKLQALHGSLLIKEEELFQLSEKYQEIIYNYGIKSDENQHFLIEIEALKKKIELVEGEKQEKIEEFQILQKKTENIKNVENPKDKEIFDAKEENQQLLKKIHSLELEVSANRTQNLSFFNELCSKTITKNQENVHLKAENDALKKKLLSYEKAVTKEKHDKLNENDKKSILEKELEKLEKVNKRMSNQKSSKDLENLLLKQEKEALKVRIQGLEANLLKIENKNTYLQSTISLKEKEIFQILEKYQEELGIKLKEVESYKERIKDLEKQLSHKDKEHLKNKISIDHMETIGEVTTSIGDPAYFSCRSFTKEESH